jgi:threonine/homoserine/homoserine lactone efflux protein
VGQSQGLGDGGGASHIRRRGGVSTERDIIAALFCVLGLASSGTWLGFGAALQRVLKDRRAVRVFNVVMALLLVASLYPIFADSLPRSGS